MQTVGRTSGGTVSAPHHPRDRKPRAAQRRAKEAGTGAGRRHPHFLTGRIRPIGPRAVTRKGDRIEEYNYVTRENYLHLRDSALNYARLLGRELDHVPQGNTGACIADLCRKLSALEPSLNLNVEPVGNRLHFVFWRSHEWGSYVLYWICADVLESLTPKMREAALLFFQKLHRTMGLPTLVDSDDAHFVLDEIAGYADGYDNEEDRRAEQRVAASYRPGGEAYELMRQIEQAPEPNADPARMLSRMRPRKEKEKELLHLLREGLRFTGADCRSIFSYAYLPWADEDDHESFIALERMVRFVYADDRFNERMTEWLNDELQGGACACDPCSWLRLTPETDRVFEQDTFPEEFFDWLEKLIDCTNNF
jgi:hypothetical protein